MPCGPIDVGRLHIYIPDSLAARLQDIQRQTHANSIRQTTFPSPGRATPADDNMLDWACESVRELARVAANPSPDASKDEAVLTEHEMSISTATHGATASDAMAATAKARNHDLMKIASA